MKSHAAPLLVPADAVAFCERDRGGRAPGPRRIWPRGHSLLGPCSADAVDPRPLRLDLVPAHEQGRVALDEVEQQPLVSDAAARLAERIGEADIERDFAQLHSGAVES